MPVSKKLQKYLAESGKRFEIVEHRTVYTAYDAAATLQVPQGVVVKTLLVKTDKPCRGYQKGYLLACCAANRNIDFKKLQSVVNRHVQMLTPKGERLVRIKKVEIPKENVMKTVFKIAPGSMHAFGSNYKLPVFVDTSVTKESETFFPGGAFTSSIKMRPSDFVALEHALVGSFSVAKKVKKASK